jgi:hypothetical protein
MCALEGGDGLVRNIEAKNTAYWVAGRGGQGQSTIEQTVDNSPWVITMESTKVNQGLEVGGERICGAWTQEVTK